jgi:hypothetical protein
MVVTYPVPLALTNAQKQNLLKGNKIVVKPSQMSNDPRNNIHMSKTQHMKLVSALNQGKSHTLGKVAKSHMIKHGTGFWDTLKAGAKMLKPLARKGLHAGVHFAAGKLGAPQAVEDFAQKGADYGFDYGAKKIGIGALRRGAPAKGSIAAKQKMARVRAMKSGKGGLYAHSR